MRLKRWESPRRQGRNDKGKGGSARQRQLKKQQQMMRKKLKGEPIQNQKPKKPQKSHKSQHKNQGEGREVYSLPSCFWGVLRTDRDRTQTLIPNPQTLGRRPTVSDFAK